IALWLMAIVFGTIAANRRMLANDEAAMSFDAGSYVQNTRLCISPIWLAKRNDKSLGKATHLLVANHQLRKQDILAISGAPSFIDSYMACELPAGNLLR